MKFTLIKNQKGKRYLYEVKDEAGNVFSHRTSTRDYVACTANGEFYFGRLDLIGKGQHGTTLSIAYGYLNNPEESYKKALSRLAPSFRAKWQAENPYGEWKARVQKWAKNRLADIENIAYLQH